MYAETKKKRMFYPSLSKGEALILSFSLVLVVFLFIKPLMLSLLACLMGLDII
jgi:hypothetical protein